MINVIIPAAGLASRLRPLSNNISKIMVRINGRPTLDYIISTINLQNEVSEIVIVDGKFNDIREYCRKRYPYIKFIKQENQTGPRDAVALGLSKIEDHSKPLVVWLGDTIIDEPITLGDDFLLVKEANDHNNWCMWDGERFYDKPTENVEDSYALVGVYSFNDGVEARRSFLETNGYDLSISLKEYKHKFNIKITDNWNDIGSLSTYYSTCAKLLKKKAREFNSFDYNQELGTLTKFSETEFGKNTISAEKFWYENISSEQSMFAPKVLKHDTNLILSFEPGLLLSDMMLFEDIPESSWRYILTKLFDIKFKYFNTIIVNDNFEKLKVEMWQTKSLQRLAQIECSDKIKSFANKTILNALEYVKCVECHHGDLHFGNILYDVNIDRIKFIDPRGSYGSHQTIIGDNLYDLAKLSHDLYHGYSAIVNNTKPNEIVKNIFLDLLDKYKLPKKLILDAGALLLLTCIPLHSESPRRQYEFLEQIDNYLNE